MTKKKSEIYENSNFIVIKLPIVMYASVPTTIAYRR